MKNFKEDKFHLHEVLDRLNLVNSIFEDFIINHPSIENRKNIKEKCEIISKNINEIYQEIGNISNKDKN